MTSYGSPAPVAAGIPSFSIIVPVRNMASTIARTLDSIFDQNYSNYETIVIDGGSSDGTREILDTYRDRISHLVSGPDNGLYDAINKGIKLATGEIVGILNGDDHYCGANVLTLYAEKFAHPEVGLVFGDLEFFPENDPARTIRHYSSKRFEPKMLRRGWMPPHPTVFVRREVYEQIGGYRTDYRISADYEFLIRALLRHSVPFDRVDSVVVRMQYGGLSTSGIRASYRLNKEIIRACRENGLDTGWWLILSKIPGKLLEFIPRNQ